MTMLRGGDVLVKTQKDLLSDTDARYGKSKKNKNSKRWNTYEDLYGDSLKGLYKISNEKKKRIIEKINNEIVNTFLEQVLKDMIDYGVEFEFPYHRFSIYIADRDRLSNRYKFDVHTGGTDYIPYLRFNRCMYNKVWVYYYLHLRPRWKKRLKEAIKNGHQYVKAIQKRKWR